MKDAQKPDHVSLVTLLNWLREGRFVIPDFQREFEWKPWDIRELMRSIFLDYYVGSLLLWRGKKENFEALGCEPVYGFEGKSDPLHIVLDGQQRLTAMYYAFMAPNQTAPGRSNRFLYFIRVDQFMEEAYDVAFEYDWTQRGIKLLDDQQLQFDSHMFPLAVFGKRGFALPNWIQGYEKHWREKAAAATAAGEEAKATSATLCAENAVAFGEHLQALIEQYQIAYIELDRELEIDKVCDIFTQINSRGIRLDIFDLMNALLKPKGLQLKMMWREAKQRLEFVETERMNVYILQVMSILRQSYCSPKYLYFLLPGTRRPVRDPDGTRRSETLVPTTDDFKASWNNAVTALEKAIDQLRDPREYGVISTEYLPYESIVPAFAALNATARGLPPERRLQGRRKVAHWYWASIFTNRYSGSVESTAARDFADVRAWLDDDGAQPQLIAEFHNRFRSLDLRRETKRGTSIYNGLFNLLVLNGARDWMTGDYPTYGELDAHHIVPQSWGRDNGLGGAIDSILNRAPLTPETNRNVIRDRLPNQYLPDLMKQSGEKEVRAILEGHLISETALSILLRNPFGAKDFEAFIDERQKIYLQAIEDLLVKERIDLPPRLRDLDSQIEQSELGLRRLVDITLGGKSELLPEQIRTLVDDRLKAALRKNPALDRSRYEALYDRLEYADLREVQDVILNKALWSQFEQKLGTKEGLQRRFDQLAGLRNAIRHSRAVDDVTRKDGEAALAWFSGVLGLPQQS